MSVASKVVSWVRTVAGRPNLDLPNPDREVDALLSKLAQPRPHDRLHERLSPTDFSSLLDHPRPHERLRTAPEPVPGWREPLLPGTEPTNLDRFGQRFPGRSNSAGGVFITDTERERLCDSYAAAKTRDARDTVDQDYRDLLGERLNDQSWDASTAQYYKFDKGYETNESLQAGSGFWDRYEELGRKHIDAEPTQEPSPEQDRSRDRW